MYDNNTYKPHWKRRSTLAREKAKANCLFDHLVTVMLIAYSIGGALWILNDAFPHLFW